MIAPQRAGGPSPQVLQWLHRVIAPEYKDPQRTYGDVVTAIGALPGLSLRTSVYTHENGKSELLVHIFGTIPVIFRGATYNIPISIWVPHQYPKHPPIVFVTPAKDMAIRPGNHVDLSGKCYHPYLANWVNYSDRSNIVDLCDVLRGVFGREPPVMANPSVISQQKQEPLAPPPRPPLPPELESQSHPPLPEITSPSPSGPPPLPPLPKELAGGHRSLAEKVADSPRPAQPQPQPPPLPPLPPQQQQQLQGQISPPPRSPYNNGSMVSVPTPKAYGGCNLQSPTTSVLYDGTPGPISPPGPIQSLYLYPHNQSPVGQPQKVQYRSSSQLSDPAKARFPSSQTLARPPSHQEYPTPLSNPHQHQRLHQPQSLQPRPSITVAAVQPKPTPVDLLDTPSPPPDAPMAHPCSTAPPPPPNPEKDDLISKIASALHSRASAAHSQTTSAFSAAAAQREALLRAEAALEREKLELSHQAELCDKDTEILLERIAAAERVIDECRARGPPDVDAVVVAPSVLQNQVYELVTEDMAISDTLYVLGKALDRERISLDVFLKHARTLAREQFLKRALVRKISDELGIVGADIDHTILWGQPPVK